MSDARGHRALAQHYLPFNRKERFFTGTVLPAIICADNLRHFDRFLGLLSPHSMPAVEAHADLTNLQFFTEYSFVEALTGTARARFPDPPHTKDTPDLVCFLRGPTDVLIAVEAKMYDSPSAGDLRQQFEAQRRLLDYLGQHLPATEIIHKMLLPAKLASRVRLEPDIPVVTWEAVVSAFQPVLGSSHYFLSILEEALRNYDDLVASSGWQSGKNADHWLSGAAILEAAERQDMSVRQVGRKRGVTGPEFAEDLRTGGWKSQSYEVSAADRPANPNWFSVEKFVQAVRGAIHANPGHAPVLPVATSSPGTAPRKPNLRKLTGAEIVERRSDPTVRQVGRGDGLQGRSFQLDVSRGTWSTQRYEVCGATSPPNRNWFTLQEFLSAVGK